MKNQRYRESIERVCDYIYLHLDEPLNLDELSTIAHFSKFHFHRLFNAAVGVNLSRFVQLLRLKRASYQLVFQQEMKVIDIALGAGYDSAEAFARAFKKNFQASPRDFRRLPNWPDWHQQYQFSLPRSESTMQNPTFDVEVVDFPETKVAAIEHLGSPQSLNSSIARFIEWRKTTGLSPIQNRRTFGVAFNDPNAVSPEAFRFDICGEVTQRVPENPQSVVNKNIPAGRCARLHYVGSRDAMDDAVYYLYSDWLAENNQETRDFPVFFEYINFFPEVAEHEQETDIFLPLK